MNAEHVPAHLAGTPRALDDPIVGVDCYAFLLVPGFTLVGFASAIEPLRMANMAAGEPLFGAVTVTQDGQPVTASNGVTIAPQYSIETMPAVATVIVCGPNPIRFPEVDRLVAWLRGLAAQGVALGSVDSGSELLARAGLLDGYRCTIHWQDLGVMLARHPNLVVSNRLYEIDRDRYTSGGGTAAMDMILALIRRGEHGPEVAEAAADLLVHDRVRDSQDHQRESLRKRLGTKQPGLGAAVAIMEGTLDDPLSVAELAVHARVSARQLERLFRERLGCTPSRYYRELRLNEARRELMYTDAPIVRIARRCGFGSSSHFTRCYVRMFGVTPSEDRRRQA